MVFWIGCDRGEFCLALVTGRVISSDVQSLSCPWMSLAFA